MRLAATSSFRLLIAAGLLSVAVLGMAHSGLMRGHLPTFFLAFLGQAAALAVALCVEAHLPAARTRTALGVILGFGLVIRTVMLPLPVFLTSDLERYAHDGAVLAAGGNPYAATPAERGRDGSMPGAETLPHANVGTVYPPAAAALFAIGARAGGAAFTFKWLAVAGDLLVLGAWLLLAPLAGWRPTRCLVWAWHPLVLWAFAGSGHVDAAAIALLLLGLRALLASRRTHAGVFLGTAAAVKLAPIALLPAWRAALGKRAWIPLGVLAIAYLPYHAAGTRLFDGPATYALRWEHMGLLHEPLAQLATPALARTVCLAALAWVAIAAARSAASPMARTRDVITSALLLTPTLHPWYVCWVVPLCEPISGFPPLLLSVTAVAGYGVLLGRPDLGVWGSTGWWWYLTWVPVAIAMALAACRPALSSHAVARSAGTTGARSDA